jgi:hypothetical protein
MLEYLRGIRGHAALKKQETPADDTMLRYFLSELDVRVKWLAPRIADDTQKEAILQEVRTALDSFFVASTPVCNHPVDDAWNRAYRLERLLALAEPQDTLFGEVQRRLEEASEETVPSAPRLRTIFESATPQVVDNTNTQSVPTLKAGGEARLRALLLDILEETHWSFQRKFHSRPIQRSATRRLVGTGLVACALFILPFVYIYVTLWVSDKTYTLPLESWPWLPLWTALTAGFFGAMFSRLLYLQANWNVLSLGALKDAREFTSILLRGAVGMTGAVIVYYFLLSGVIGGGLFPHFDKIGLDQKHYSDGSKAVPLNLILPNADLALLVVWSFLAGFSERLVPSILQSAEGSIRDNAQGARR